MENRTRKVTIQRRQTKQQVTDSFQSYGFEQDIFQSVLDNSLSIYDYEQDEFKSMNDLDQIEYQNKPNQFQEIIESSVDDEFSLSTNRMPCKPLLVEVELQNFTFKLEQQKEQEKIEHQEKNEKQDLQSEKNISKSQKISPTKNKDQQEEPKVRKAETEKIKEIQISLDELPKKYEQKLDTALQFRRLQRIKIKQNASQPQHKIKTQFQFSFDISTMILTQIQNSKIFTSIILYYLISDIIFRVNYAVFIWMISIQNSEYIESLLFFLMAPRLIHILSLCTLLFLNRYKQSNRSLLRLSHLFRSNFIEETILVDMGIHPKKRQPSTNIMSIRVFLFITLPVELSVFALRFVSNRVAARNTYIISCNILIGIEAVIFRPILYVYMLAGRYSIINNQYEQITQWILVVSIFQYLAVSILLIIRGNNLVQSQQIWEHRFLNFRKTKVT